ncbi:MAG: putative DNA-binding domain-containing protein [Xanthobacteraceae bacterium]
MPAPFEVSFARALLDPQAPIPFSVAIENGATPVQHFAVHRNNVVAGLIKTLQARFPVVEKIVGQEFFAAMARVFVARAPPRTPILTTYGDEFADFIAAFEPARELAYLADVARLEAARTRAYHAADAVPVDTRRFAALDPDAVSEIRVSLHPSAETVCSPHPIVTIWAMNSGERELAPIEDWHGEDALVVRPRLDVEVRLLPTGGAAFLLALSAGRPVGEAAEAAFADYPQFDLSRSLAELMNSGIVIEIIAP